MHFVTDIWKITRLLIIVRTTLANRHESRKTISLIQSEAPEAWKDILALMHHGQSNRQVTTFRWSTRDAAFYRELIKKQINSSLPSRKSTLYNEFSVRIVISRPFVAAFWSFQPEGSLGVLHVAEKCRGNGFRTRAIRLLLTSRLFLPW